MKNIVRNISLILHHWILFWWMISNWNSFEPGTTTTAVPDPVEEYVSVLIPAIIVPVIFFIVLFLFCVWLKLSKNKAGPRKPSTYEDFSHVDNTEVIILSHHDHKCIIIMPKARTLLNQLTKLFKDDYCNPEWSLIG